MGLAHHPEKSQGVLVLVATRDAHRCRTTMQGPCQAGHHGFSALGARHQVSPAWTDQGVILSIHLPGVWNPPI